MMRSPVFLLTLISAFLYGISQTIIFVVLPPVSRSIGLHDFQVGILLSSSALAFVLTSGFWGKRADVSGRRVVLILGLLGASVPMMVFGALLDFGTNDGFIKGGVLFAALLLVRIVYGAFASATHPASVAIIADLTSEAERSIGTARLGAMFGLGAIAGPIFALSIASKSPGSPFYVAGALILLCIILVSLMRKSWPAKQVIQTNEVEGKAISASDIRIRPWLIITVLLFTVLSMIQQITGFFVTDAFKLETTEAIVRSGYLLSLLAAGMVGAQIITGLKQIAQPMVLVILGSVLIAGSAFVAIFVKDVQTFSAIYFVLGIALGLIVPNLVSLISTSVNDSEQGAAAGLGGAATAAGYFIGPLLSTSIYSMSESLPLAVICLFAVAMTYMSLRTWGQYRLLSNQSNV